MTTITLPGVDGGKDIVIDAGDGDLKIDLPTPPSVVDHTIADFLKGSGPFAPFGLTRSELEGGSPNVASSRAALEVSWEGVRRLRAEMDWSITVPIRYVSPWWMRRVRRWLAGGKPDGRPTARQRRRARRDRRGW